MSDEVDAGSKKRGRGEGEETSDVSTMIVVRNLPIRFSDANLRELFVNFGVVAATMGELEYKEAGGLWRKKGVFVWVCDPHCVTGIASRRGVVTLATQEDRARALASSVQGLVVAEGLALALEPCTTPVLVPELVNGMYLQGQSPYQSTFQQVKGKPMAFFSNLPWEMGEKEVFQVFAPHKPIYLKLVAHHETGTRQIKKTKTRQKAFFTIIHD
jgi:hypothetical protein